MKLHLPLFLSVLSLFLAGCSSPPPVKVAMQAGTQDCMQFSSAVTQDVQKYDVQRNAGHQYDVWHESSVLNLVFFSPKTNSCLYLWSSTNYQKDHLYSTKMYLSDASTNQIILQCFHISSNLDTCAAFQQQLAAYKG